MYVCMYVCICACVIDKSYFLYSNLIYPWYTYIYIIYIYLKINKKLIKNS